MRHKTPENSGQLQLPRFGEFLTADRLAVSARVRRRIGELRDQDNLKHPGRWESLGEDRPSDIIDKRRGFRVIH